MKHIFLDWCEPLTTGLYEEHSRCVNPDTVQSLQEIMAHDNQLVILTVGEKDKRDEYKRKWRAAGLDPDKVQWLWNEYHRLTPGFDYDLKARMMKDYQQSKKVKPIDIVATVEEEDPDFMHHVASAGFTYVGIKKACFLTLEKEKCTNARAAFFDALKQFTNQPKKVVHHPVIKRALIGTAISSAIFVLVTAVAVITAICFSGGVAAAAIIAGVGVVSSAYGPAGIALVSTGIGLGSLGLGAAAGALFGWLREKYIASRVRIRVSEKEDTAPAPDFKGTHAQLDDAGLRSSSRTSMELERVAPRVSPPAETPVTPSLSLPSNEFRAPSPNL